MVQNKFNLKGYQHAGLFILLAFSICPISLGESDRETSLRAQSYFFFIRATLENLDSNPQNALSFFEKAQTIDQSSSYLKLRRAEELLNLSRSDEAKGLLIEIETAQKSDPEFYVLRARLYSQVGQFGKSLKDLDIASNLFFEKKNISKAREMLLTKVALQADQRDYRGAVATLESYLKKSAQDEIGYYFLGKIHSIFQNKMAAKKAFKKALDIRPSFLAASKSLGLILELEGKTDQAFNVYQDANRAGVMDEELLQKLINLSLIRDDYHAALDFLQQHLSQRPSDLQSLLRSGLVHYKLSDFNAAVDDFKTALEQEDSPKDRIYFYLGTIAVENESHSAALEHFEKVSENSDYFIEARLQMTSILGSKILDYQKANRLIDEAIEKKPKAVELLLAKSSLVEQEKGAEKASDFLDGARKNYPNNERLLFMLGSLQDKIGRFDDSIKTMKEILSINADNAHALNHIGYSYAERGIHLKEAESLLKRAVQLSPKNGYILDSLGWTYFKMGKLKKAFEVLSRANVLSPDQPVILEHLGDVLWKIGQTHQALEIYERVMKISNGDQGGKSIDLDTENRDVRERVREKIALIADSSNR